MAKVTATNLTRAMEACLDNAWRLLEETYDLEFRQPPASRYFLATIAQEEAAKAFIIHLVVNDILSLSPAMHRAIRDHSCKHLVGMIMDYLIMHWDTEEELQALIQQEYVLASRSPDDVGSALEIFAYEKVGRWTGGFGVWAEDPRYDPKTQNVANGKKDRKKQDALYVRLGADGQVASTPTAITEAETQLELDRAKRLVHYVRSLSEDAQGADASRRFEQVGVALGALFQSTASALGEGS